MNKLNPLHTTEWVCAQVLNTGCYPDAERMTGRTTARALEWLALAIKSPHQPIKVTDHHDTYQSHCRMAELVRDMARTLGLQHIQVCLRTHTVTFTRK
jgi:hypothetical protein